MAETTPGIGGVTAGAATADLGKRFIAAVIDFVLVALVGLIPILGGLIGALYLLIRDGLEVEFMDRRSLGKKLLGLRLERLDGGPVDVVTSMKRNVILIAGALVWAIPILGWVLGPIVGLLILLVETVALLADPGRERLGDKLAGTRVVEAR